MDYQAQAIILKTYRLGEADKILHLYSRQHGPLRAVAKSAYKIKTKIGAKAQVLNCLDLVLAQGQNLDIIKEASRVDNFGGINSNYSALSLSYLMVDILDHIAINDDQYQEPFDLLFNHLKQMNQISMGSDVDQEELMVAASARYLWQLIKILGYKPELDHCSLSHKKRSINQIPQYFDFANGSITSSMARSHSLEQNPYQDQIQEFRPGVFKVLHYFNLLDTYTQNLKADTILYQLRSMNDRSRSLNNSLAFLQKHLSFMIHKEFKSWKLVDELLNPKLAEAA
ncbi:MAG: DNA repair protein RecO [Cyanobacteria bacterium]|nr:DNA repair protein RecO [Cyanobacteriota bacterium]MDA1021439.1 DNA repair protein RecO [Cyanobacteriota bacterium]